MEELLDWIESATADHKSKYQNRQKIDDAIKDIVAFGSSAVEPVINRLLLSQDRWNQSIAIRILDQIGDKRAIEPLWNMFQASNPDSEHDWWLHRDTLIALGRLKDKRIFDNAISLLDNWYIPMRIAAVVALGDLAESRALPFLIPRLYAKRQEREWVSSGQYGHFRLRIVVALAQIDHPDAKAALNTALYHPARSVRRCVQRRLRAVTR